MRRIVVCLLMGLFLLGCAKGDKGKDGENAVISTKTYSGTPTSNPYVVYCQNITDLSTQAVAVYAVDGSYLLPLPLTGSAVSHLYAFTTSRNVELATLYMDGTDAPRALQNPNGSRYSYQIVVKTFNSAQAKQAYLAQNRLDTNARNSIIWGREIVNEK